MTSWTNEKASFSYQIDRDKKACLSLFNPVYIRIIMSGRIKTSYLALEASVLPDRYQTVIIIMLYHILTRKNRFLDLFMRKNNPYIRRIEMSLHQSQCDIVTQHVTMCQASPILIHSINFMFSKFIKKWTFTVSGPFQGSAD